MSAEKVFLAQNEIQTLPEFDYGYEAIHGLISPDSTNFRAGFFPRGLLVCEVSSGFYDPYINGGYVTIEECQDVWTAGSNVTASLDTETPCGSYSVKLAVTATPAAGDIIAYEAVTSMDLSTIEFITGWFKSSVALDAGDYTLHTDDTAAIASPVTTTSLPAAKAGEWTYFCVAISGGSAATISVGLKMAVDKGAHDFWIADVRGATVQASAAVGVLKENVYFSALRNEDSNYNGTTGIVAKIFTHGEFFKDKVIGYDANALTDLSGTLKQNSTVLKF